MLSWLAHFSFPFGQVAGQIRFGSRFLGDQYAHLSARGDSGTRSMTAAD